ncbi:MAG TPA: four helix bundle protein [Polyangia bacterium]|jgi:four helix bundle protein|nr:four helix bundle protein [Polyangia bacterium]
MFGFQKLDVYRCAVTFLGVASTLAERVPRGRSALADQLRRAALSVPLNIAGGSGKGTMEDREARRFYAIARGSALECAAIVDALQALQFVLGDDATRAHELLDKTRLIEFGRFALRDRQRRGEIGSPETFNFLGFTHICGCNRKAGRYQVQRRTMRKRMTAKLHEVKPEMQRRRHLPIPDHGRWLAAVLRGHYAYYGVPTNYYALDAFRSSVVRNWYRSLRDAASDRDWTGIG